MAWAIEDSLDIAESRLAEIAANFPVKGVGTLIRLIALPLGRRYCPPSDRTGARVARLLIEQQKKKVMVVSCDVYRPAAIEQLRALGKQLDVTVYDETGEALVDIQEFVMRRVEDRAVMSAMASAATAVKADSVKVYSLPSSVCPGPLMLA